MALDALEAAWLWALLPRWRRQAQLAQQRLTKHYVIVAGSTGKSTATNVAGELMKAQASAATGLFYNTERHVLRYMRHLHRPADYFVQEVSEYPVGTLAAVARTMRPEGAVVTAIGREHASEFRSVEAVRDEFATLCPALPATAFVGLNADDPEVLALRNAVRGPVLLFGRAAGADLRAENIRAEMPARMSFDLVIGNTRRHVQTRFAGTLFVTSVLAALTLVHGLGLDLDRAIADLATVEPIWNRLGVRSGLDQHIYVLDTAKAPVWSTEKVIADLANWGAMPRIVVLADMSDAAGNASGKYRRVLKAAARVADLVIGVSQAESQARHIHAEFPNVRPATDMDEVRRLIEAQPASVVLLKTNKRVWLPAVVPEPRAELADG